MTKRIGVVCALALCACSSSNGGDDSPIMIEGQLFAIASASSGVVTASNGEYVQIILSSQSDACEQIGSGIQHPQQQTIIIDVGNGTSPPTASGAYPVSEADGTPAGQYAQVFAQSTDANCQLTLVPEPSGVSGSVTLTSVANGALAGMFDVTFETGDHVTGSFSADSCPAIGSASDDPACK